MGYSKEAERQNKALESILRGGTPEKRVMVGYNADKGEDKNGKTIESHLTKIMQEARMPWFCPECDKVMKHRLDDKMWRLFGQCFDCQIKEENKLITSLDLFARLSCMALHQTYYKMVG